MARKLSTTSRNFAEELWQLLQRRNSTESDVRQAVSDILVRVRAQGDAAVADYTRQFDRWDAANITVSQEEMANAISLCSPELMKSLKAASTRIRAYSERQLPQDEDYTDTQGLRLGWHWNAIEAVGLYVPGGTAAYPSSVLMNAIPAKVAGVDRLVMVVPAPEGKLSPAVLAAAHLAGVAEIYKIGGAQAIAALAYGTQSIAAVDKIVGPGNAYVAEAKRQVFGQVGIDMIAGPSEILVIADADNNPDWIAADLLSQAEHDPMAQSLLITDNGGFASKVEKAVTQQLRELPRSDIAAEAWKHHSAVILVRDMQEAVAIANACAPEHLELAVENPNALLPMIRNAGAIFLGRYTPEAIGDYVAGPSHVLPTSRTARFSSGLSVLDFMKRSSIIGCSRSGFRNIAQYGEVLAVQEGLEAHARSIKIRYS